MKSIKNLKFIENEKILEINGGIYFLETEKIRITQNKSDNSFEYMMEIEFSHLKNYFFITEKLKLSFTKYLCKRIIYSFLKLRSESLSFTDNPFVDISYNFYFSDNEILLFC